MLLQINIVLLFKIINYILLGPLNEVEEVLFKEVEKTLQRMKRNRAVGFNEVTEVMTDALLWTKRIFNYNNRCTSIIDSFFYF